MIERSKILVVSKDGIIGHLFSALKNIEIKPSSIEVCTLSEFENKIQRNIEQTGLPSLMILEVPDDNESVVFLSELRKFVALMDIPIINVHASTDCNETKLIEIIRANESELNNQIYSEVDHKEMVLIPAGVYKRRKGLSPTYFASALEADQQVESHTGAYYIDKYPVTNAEYEYFIHTSKSPPPKHWRDGRYPAGLEDHPVTGVNWYDVLKYAKWAKKRVLTPDEWEKAAFGNSGLKYPWGDDLDTTKCNVADSKIGGTTPVYFYDNKGGNSCYGVSDLIGNVWGWVYDWTAASNNQMLIGGAWDTPTSLLEAPNYARVRSNPQLCGMNFGFRLAISLETYLRNRS